MPFAEGGREAATVSGAEAGGALPTVVDSAPGDVGDRARVPDVMPTTMAAVGRIAEPDAIVIDVLVTVTPPQVPAVGGRW